MAMYASYFGTATNFSVPRRSRSGFYLKSIKNDPSCGLYYYIGAIRWLSGLIRFIGLYMNRWGVANYIHDGCIFANAIYFLRFLVRG